MGENTSEREDTTQEEIEYEIQEEKPKTKKFRLIAEIPAKKTEQTESEPILKEKLNECPDCGETEEWYYDENHEAYYCAKCRKIYIPD